MFSLKVELEVVAGPDGEDHGADGRVEPLYLLVPKGHNFVTFVD